MADGTPDAEPTVSAAASPETMPDEERSLDICLKDHPDFKDIRDAEYVHVTVKKNTFASESEKSRKLLREIRVFDCRVRFDKYYNSSDSLVRQTRCYLRSSNMSYHLDMGYSCIETDFYVVRDVFHKKGATFDEVVESLLKGLKSFLTDKTPIDYFGRPISSWRSDNIDRKGSYTMRMGFGW